MKDAQLKIWSIIVEKVCQSQIKAGDQKGHFHNPIINDTYYRETAFGAKILAIEWQRTKDIELKEKALLALNCVKKILKTKSLVNGIDEPLVTFRGINYRRGSIPATILLVFALQEAALLLDETIDINLGDLSKYVKACEISPGRYYHDKIDNIRRRAGYSHVINTSSMALLYYTRIEEVNNSICCNQRRIQDLMVNICRSQRSDGLWNYIEPNFIQRLIYPCSKIFHGKTGKRFVRDNSILFGDAVHHCITLNYLLKSVDLKKGNKHIQLYRNSICKGWEFIEKKLILLDNEQIRFDFTWEPTPRHLRYCNFIDSTTYFYILDIITEMQKACLMTEKKGRMYFERICNYVYDKLLDPRLGIAPYDGPDEVYNKIIPRAAESIFLNGYLMANTVIGNTKIDG